MKYKDLIYGNLLLRNLQKNLKCKLRYLLTLISCKNLEYLRLIKNIRYLIDPRSENSEIKFSLNNIIITIDTYVIKSPFKPSIKFDPFSKPTYKRSKNYIKYFFL